MSNSNLFDLSGKVAIVTGGNGGLGLGMALGLADAGANIVVAARNAQKTAEALVKIGYLRRIVGRGKVDAAVDFVARAVRMGEPVVLFAEHVHVIRAIARKLKKQR